MYLRNLREQDLVSCLEVKPQRIGTELVGRERAIKSWAQLIQSRSFNATVIEMDRPGQRLTIVGFGASVFVSPAFARDEIANPRPGLNARIIASIAAGHSVVLSEAELRFANTDGDLDLVILYGSFDGNLNGEQLSEGYTLMSAKFLEQHVGYRIQRMINEVVDDKERQFNDRTNVWKEISNYNHFWENHPDSTWKRSRALHLIQREMFAWNGVMIDLLFLRRKPVLDLHEIDQALLIAALGGMPDEELARTLRQNLTTIKKRWVSLFGRTLERRPDLFPDVVHDPGPTRGKQKRHHLLSYVRSHPEELRPYESKARPRKRLA